MNAPKHQRVYSALRQELQAGRWKPGQRLPSEAELVVRFGASRITVGRAVREVRPWAVDVSSGVERSRGVKDPRKIIEFIRSVRREDAGLSA